MRLIGVFNSGSSSLKCAFYNENLELRHRIHADRVPQADASLRVEDAKGNTLLERNIGKGGHEAALGAVLGWLEDAGIALISAGHRVVHGGTRAAPARVTQALMDELHALTPLAPLHQPHNLRIIEALARAQPDLPQTACFDTAFHQTQSDLATRFALPRALHEQGIRRYGFHGLSYEFIAGELPRIAGERANGRVAVAHLGNGASLCAMENGRSVACSMGFSTLDGLMMGTRCGTLDAGVPLHLQRACGMEAEAVEKMLYEQSGLLGVSGISHDMRTLEQSPAPEAADAIALFARMAAMHLGALMPLLGGLDALVFTGGIGENSARVRREICDYFRWAGLALDERKNRAGECALHAPESAAAVYVIPTDEEAVIARYASAACVLSTL